MILFQTKIDKGVNDTAVITSAGDLTRLDPKLHPCEVKFHNLRKQKKGFVYILRNPAYTYNL